MTNEEAIAALEALGRRIAADVERIEQAAERVLRRTSPDHPPWEEPELPFEEAV